MVTSFYFLSQGWAMATYSPFYILFILCSLVFLESIKLIVCCLHSSSFFLHPFIFVKSDYVCVFCCELNVKLPFKDSPDPEVQTEEVLGMAEMAVPIFAGILSALRRVTARRVSLKVLILICLLICSYHVLTLLT